MSDDFKKEFNDYYHPGCNEQDWAHERTTEIFRNLKQWGSGGGEYSIGNETHKFLFSLVKEALKQEREIEWPIQIPEERCVYVKTSDGLREVVAEAFDISTYVEYEWLKQSVEALRK